MRILFIGTGEIGLPTLRMLSNWRDHKLVGVVTQPDKPVGRDQKLTSPSPKREVQDLGLDLPVLQPDRIKSLESVDAIRALKPEDRPGLLEAVRRSSPHPFIAVSSG